MVRCDFCGTSITRGKGKIYVKKDGKVLNFCSNKCEKNMFKLKRKPRTIAWTEEYKKTKAMRIATLQHKKEDEKTVKKK